MIEQASQQFLENAEFQSLLVACLEQLERGESLDREQLLAEHPQFAEALNEFLADQAMLKQVASGVRDSLGRSPAEPRVDRLHDETIDSNPRGNGFSAGDRIRYIGEYEILDEIARGGMGIVFKARQQKLDRIVALKMILSGQLADEADVERFHREAQAAGKLRHPGIVAVHEIGQHEGHHYFTMDYIQGHSLADEIRDETLAPVRAAELVKEVSEAIHFAHQQGTTHRDLKPANILIDDQHRPHVADFGLAKIVRDDDTRAHLTVTGQILGTPSYMSPEQASGNVELTGPASDIYSLGAILYACLTGRAPFVAESPVETLLQVVKQDPVSPRQLTPSIPKDLETICLKCLSKEPRQRYQTAQHLADDLNCWMSGIPIKARPAGPLKRAWKWSRRHPAWTALMLVLVLSTAVVTWLWRRAETASELAESASELASDRLYANQVALAEREWQAHNRDRAVEILMESDKSRRQWEWDLVMRLCLATPNVRLATGKEPLSTARFSPSGKYLVVANGKRVVIRDAQGLAVLGVIDEPISRLEFMPDSDSFAAGVENCVKLYSARTGAAIKTLFEGEKQVRPVAFDEAGERLSIVGIDNKIVVVDATTAEVVVSLPPQSHRAWDTALAYFLRDANRLIVCCPTTISMNLDGTLTVWDLEKGKNVERISVPQTEKNRFLLESFADIAADGNRIAMHGLQGASNPIAQVFDRSTNEIFRITPGHGGVESIQSVELSPDGETIAIAVWQHNLGPEDVPDARNDLSGMLGAMTVMALKERPSRGSIYIHDIKTGRLLRELRGQIGSTSGNGLAISPDGLRVVAAGSYRPTRIMERLEERSELRTWDLGEMSPCIVLRGHAFPVVRVAISPDGKLIASGDERGQVRVWRASGELVRILNSEDEAFKGLAFANQGQELVVADHEHIVWLNLNDGSEAGRVDIDTNSAQDWDQRVRSLRGSASGKFVGYHSKKRAVVLDAATREEIRVIDRAFVEKTQGPTDPDYGPKHSSGVFPDPTGRLIAITYYFDLHGELRTWDLATGRPGIHVETEQVGNPFRTGWGLLNAAFSPDGSRVVGVGNNGPAQIWDTSTGERLLELKGHSGFIWAVAYSPDGKRIATGSFDKTVKIWDAASGREMLTLRGHLDNVRDVAFSPDGKLLVSAGNDQTVRIWNADLDGFAAEMSTNPEEQPKLPELQSVDEATRTDALLGREMNLARAAYRQEIISLVADYFKRKTYGPTNSSKPGDPPVYQQLNRKKCREDTQNYVANEKQKILDLNAEVGHDGVDNKVLTEELDAEFETLFTSEYDRLLSLAAEWQRKRPEGRKALELPKLEEK